MNLKLLPKLNYSNVIATIALFVALGGAAVAAGLPRNSVGPNQLKRGAVTAAKIRKQAVTSGKLAPGAVTPGKIGPNAVGPSNIGNGAITSAKIAAGAVIANSIKNGVVTTNKLNNGAVTGQKLAANAVGTANLQNNAVGTANLANGSVTAAKLNKEAGPLLGNLKNGQTLQGVFDLGGSIAGKEAGLVKATAFRDSVSFQFPLANTPQANVLQPGATSTACPGAGAGNANPQAAAGQLCVYIVSKTAELESLEIDAGTASRLGFGLLAKFKDGEANGAVQGVWAVTAP
ncbi:MAG TPA: hypothetical protein VHA54_09530 [Solirubrobacterales bacterium]|nr:hypothetical protein [Solirubrobacterales bacterium]